MKVTRILVQIFLLVTLISTPGLVPPTAPALPAYLDPGLLAQGAAPAVDIIVMAGSAEAASQAVKAQGGAVLAELPLVDGVHASLPADRLQTLAGRPGIRSIVRNQTITPSGDITFNGYATHKRLVKSNNSQSGTQVTQPVYLPDGGFAAVDQNGRLLVANPDGTQRAVLSLAGAPFLTQPVVAADGSIFIAGQAPRLYAIDPSGVIRWQYAAEGSAKFLGGVALGPTGTVFAADSLRFVYALDPSNGQLLWKYKIGPSGIFKSAPAVGPDGSLYLTSDKGFVYALDPAGSQKWAYYTAVALNQSPVIGLDGQVYVAQVGGRQLFCLDAATGSLKYKKSTYGTLRTNPLPGPDGSLYVPTEPGLLALAPDGSLRFYFPASGGLFKTPPALAPDGQTLYAAVEGPNLFAIDTATGQQRWVYLTSGKMFAAPVVTTAGEIIIGTDASLVDIVSPLGGQVDRASLPDKVTQSAAVSSAGDITVRAGSLQLVSLGLPPKQWDGRPDVIPTTNKNYYELVNPVNLDIGVDRLHETQLTNSRKIRGAGVTVAVIDSGLYFDPETISVLSGRINLQFLGQVDFVDRDCPIRIDGITAGVQYPGFCFINAPNRQYSRDGYGHGTHMAGVIWNNLVEARTNTLMGVAPEADILSVRVLNNEGVGSYVAVIQGLAWVIAHKDDYHIRVVNLSLSAPAQTPYFADPLNRAVEAAWASGLVVVAAAGNTGPVAESISVPGNDPYVITVGAVSEKRTPGYWADDELPTFSATGPTLDGFIKPDILAPGTQIVSFLYNECKAAWAGPDCLEHSQLLARTHGDYSASTSLFRMSGTSLSTAITSGVAALMLQVNPNLTPNEVKFRLKYSAQLAVAEDGEPTYNLLQQGYGRLWAPAAVLGSFPSDAADNLDMNILADLIHDSGWVDTNLDGMVQFEELDPAQLAFHYQGQTGKLVSDDGRVALYYLDADDPIILGAAETATGAWLDRQQLDQLAPTWKGGELAWVQSSSWTEGGWTWGSGHWTWGGGHWTWGGSNWAWGGGHWTWGGGHWTWGGSNWAWSGGHWTWGGGNWTWGGGHWTWGGGHWTWGGGHWTWGGGHWTWGGTSNSSATDWVDD